jgi:hypothetical protein
VGWGTGSYLRGKGRSDLRRACARIGEPDRVEELCVAKLLELRAWEVGHRDNLGSCCLVAAVSAGLPGGVWEQGGRASGGRKEGAEIDIFRGFIETFAIFHSRARPLMLRREHILSIGAGWCCRLGVVAPVGGKGRRNRRRMSGHMSLDTSYTEERRGL